MDGLHVVISRETGAVITVYRNSGFREKEFEKRSHPRRSSRHRRMALQPVG